MPRTPRPAVLVAIAGLLACAPPAPVAGSPPATRIRASAWVRVTDWPRLPAGFTLGGVTSVAVDGRGRVIVLHRAGRVFNEAGIARTDPITDGASRRARRDDGGSRP